MKKLVNFDDYILNKIFESTDSKETAIILSDRLYKILININHPIAHKLSEFNNDYIKGSKATLIDYDEKDFGNFTYTVPGKLIDYIENNDPGLKHYLRNNELLKQLGRSIDELWTKYRSPIKIGKLINKLFPDEFKAAVEKNSEGEKINEGEDIESFTNLFKLEREEKIGSMERFKIVEGDDIIKYYNVNNYVENSYSSPLGNSCMRGSGCKNYINFYAKNKDVKLVIYMSKKEEDKILGRALLWDIEYIDGEKVDRKFMDRIYYVYETDMMLFKEFAKQNGWLHKDSQNSASNCLIIDTLTNKENNFKLKTPITFNENDQYPYMDTLKYFYNDEGYLSNRDDEGSDYYFLESTSGGYDDNRHNDEDEDDNRIYCELGDEYVDEDDAIYIESSGCYATQRYVDNNMVWSEIENDYIEQDDAIWSDYHDGYIYHFDAIEVYKEGDSDLKDYKDLEKLEDDKDFIHSNVINDFILYNIRGDRNSHYFHKDDDYNFIKVKSLSKNRIVNVHKVWDKDKIFTYNGMKYYNDDPIKKDELIGQKRINF
jgi:hypothetical protein